MQVDSKHEIHNDTEARATKKMKGDAEYSDRSNQDKANGDSDEGGFIPQPHVFPTNAPVQAQTPTCPSWSCRGCGRCGIHHTTPLSGCWACLKVMMNGPAFDADRWGDFNICQHMKTERLKMQL
mmetsp:Transcript_17747/g.37264  ORF Transcript_17747/g.37264 Transcript_17747/m.37264 type:complete len:124 (-) Transcript_17747:564-935(-)